MMTLRSLIARNCKVYFRDKGVFFPSLIAPLIILFLFIAFLGDVYRESIRNVVEGFDISNALVESIASGWLISSLLAVTAVTTAFTANIIMVSDRVNGQASDFAVSPAPRSTVALAYFISSYAVTAVICFTALAAGFVYIGVTGWHLSVWDVFAAILDTLLLIFFGTALSSIVCACLRSQGAVVAVQVIISSAYGFLCGAYMPFSSLTPWLKDVITCLPGSFGTVLLHEHFMGGAIEAVTGEGMPEALVEGLKSGFDCKLDFFGHAVPEWTCYLVLGLAVLILLAIYVAMCVFRKRRKH